MDNETAKEWQQEERSAIQEQRKAKLVRLKRQARIAAKHHGHSLKMFKTLSETRAEARCRFCTASVMVITDPAPNEIDIGGEAVAISCNRVTEKMKLGIEVIRKADGKYSVSVEPDYVLGSQTDQIQEVKEMIRKAIDTAIYEHFEME